MVKLVEIFNQSPEMDNLPFNIVEDMSIFMRNNPMFYRKYYYPAVISLKELYRKKKEINPTKIFNSIIDKAIVQYCREFNVGKRPNELITNEERKDLIQTIYEEELENIREGTYD